MAEAGNINEDLGGENTEQVETTVDPFVERAKEMGWRPKEEFQGDEVDFVDAKEFVQRTPLFEKIESQNKVIKNLTKSFEALKGHHTKVREMEYQRALASLKQERQNAINEADGTRFEVADSKIKEVEQQYQELQTEAAQNTSAPDPAEFVAWQKRNEWYGKDTEMREYADIIGTQLARQGNMSPGEVLQEVTRKVKTTFSHKFVNPNKASAPDVGVSGGRSGNASSAAERFELTDFERQVMNTLVRDKTMTKEQYIAELKALDKAGKR